jgi:hypothetical protein
MNPKFPDTAILKDAGMRNGSRIFELAEPFRYESRIGWIEVPAGFHTDGASIPRVFWNILSPFGDYFPAALVHDFMYSKASKWLTTREQADLIFLDAMYDVGVGWLTRHTIHRAVRLAGWASYKQK